MKNFYNKEDLEGMLSESEINGDEMQGDYFAIGGNGKAHHATHVNKYLPGGTFFFCIPASVKILGYVPAREREGGGG